MKARQTLTNIQLNKRVEEHMPSLWCRSGRKKSCFEKLKTVKFPQYCKLNRHNSENAEEWMERLRLAAKEYSYQEFDRWLKRHLSMVITC